MALLERITPRLAKPVWTTVAVLALLVSFAPLFALPVSTAIVSGLMHIAVGAVIIALMRRTAKPAPAKASPVLING